MICRSENGCLTLGEFDDAVWILDTASPATTSLRQGNQVKRGEKLRGRAHWTISRECHVEQRLVNHVQHGHHEAFYELVRPHQGRVYAVAFQILRNEADAEDCTQEVVLKALKGIRQFRGEARFSVWLMQIAVNEARSRKRKECNVKWGPMPRDFADWREIPSEALERKEIWERLAQALRSLGAIYREVFMLRDIDQLSIAATARLLGISTGAVKTRLLRARLMLRDRLASSWGPVGTQVQRVLLRG